jgi:hypothetical protein
MNKVEVPVPGSDPFGLRQLRATIMSIFLPARTDVACSYIMYHHEKILSKFREDQATYEGHARQIASDVVWRRVASFAFSSKLPLLWPLVGFFCANSSQLVESSAINVFTAGSWANI